MFKPKTITWQLLRGNKYNRCLHPAMVTINGCVKQMAITPVGQKTKEHYNIYYDREYVVNWLAVKVIKPLENMGFKDIAGLVIEAWNIRHKDEPVTSFTKIIPDTNEQ